MDIDEDDSSDESEKPQKKVQTPFWPIIGLVELFWFGTFIF